jgi:uncharacterized damage-inducible protein DinB
MTTRDPKTDLHRYLQVARDAVLWKLEGLDEYDVRRPVVRTGTNLLGLVKHLAGVEAGYLGEVFGRRFDEPMSWYEEGAEPDADLWATAEETREDIVALYRRVWAHADATIAELPLDAPARVPWWSPGRQDVTLQLILLHVATETHRHAGHADILRELLDGTVGLRPEADNLTRDDDAAWAAHRARLEEVAQRFRGPHRSEP